MGDEFRIPQLLRPEKLAGHKISSFAGKAPSKAETAGCLPVGLSVGVRSGSKINIIFHQ